MAAKAKRHETEIECSWINQNALESNIAIGGAGGSKFELIGSDGVYLKTLIFHLEHNRLKGLKATLTDGRDCSVGRFPGSNELRFDFEPGEEFSKIVLCGARVPGYDTLLCGGAIIHTKKGRVIDAMPTSKGGLREEIIHPVGSGLCVGVFGRCGWEIDCLGFAMQKEILVG